MKRIDTRPSAILIEVSRQLRQELYMPVHSRTHFIARLGPMVHVMDAIGEVLSNTMRHRYVEA